MPCAAAPVTSQNSLIRSKMPDTYDDPYQPLRDHVELAITALELPHDTAERLRWQHEAAMTLDPVAGVPRYLDGSRDTPEWLRNAEKRDARLLGKAPATAKAPAPTDLTNATFTQLAAASKRGDAAADAELNRRMRHGDGTPAPTFNLTQTMISAKAGDAAARAALDSFFSRN